MAETMTGQPADGYVRGKYMGFFMLMFMPLGIVLWIILDNPGMIGIGVALGISIGVAVLWNPALAPEGPRKLPADSPSRVGVVTEIDGLENCFSEVLCVAKCP